MAKVFQKLAFSPIFESTRELRFSPSITACTLAVQKKQENQHQGRGKEDTNVCNRLLLNYRYI